MKKYSQIMDTAEKNYLLRLGKKYNWHMSKMVKASGIAHSQLYRLVSKHVLLPKVGTSERPLLKNVLPLNKGTELPREQSRTSRTPQDQC